MHRCAWTCLFLFMMSTYAIGNSSQWAYAIHIDDTKSNIYSVEQTFDGGFVAAGSWFRRLWVYPFWGALLIRLDSSGELQYARTYGERGKSQGYMLFMNSTLQTADGGFVIAGSRLAYPYREALVVKLDATGKILWQKAYGRPSSNVEAFSIVQTPDGNFFLLGTTVRSGDSDVWCMKLSSDGSILWQKTYGNNITRQSLANAVATNDGGVIFVGSTQVKADNIYRGFPWAVRLNQDGHIVWQKIYSVESAGNVSAVTTTADGGYVVGYDGGWVLKLGAKGVPQWKTAFRNEKAGIVSVSAVRQEMDGHILVTGTVNRDIWTARLDSEGKMFWQNAFGGTGYDSVATIHDTPDDGTIFAGQRSGARHEVLFQDGLIARTSSRGMVCTAFQKTQQITSYKTSVRAKPAYVPTRENTLVTKTVDLFVISTMSVKTINLCADK